MTDPYMLALADMDRAATLWPDDVRKALNVITERLRRARRHDMLFNTGRTH